MRDDRAIPRWAKIAIVVLEVLGFVGLVVVLLFMGNIASFVEDRVGATAVIIGCLAGTAIIVGNAYWVFDRPARRRP